MWKEATCTGRIYPDLDFANVLQLERISRHCCRPSRGFVQMNIPPVYVDQDPAYVITQFLPPVKISFTQELHDRYCGQSQT